MFIENVADHEGQRPEGARPEFEEGAVQQVEGEQGQWGGPEFRVWPGVSLAGVCVGRRVSGGSGGHLGVRVCPGSSGTRMSLARDSCGS